MFYFNTDKPILKYAENSATHPLHSFFVPNKIFSGQYWDEFSLPSLLVKQKEQRVLMLGLGQGAGIRPILATGLVSEIIGVDSDKDAIESTEETYATFFPLLKFKTVVSDATEDLKTCKNDEWDVIWVDLYTTTGYPEAVLEASFFELLHKKIKQDGAIAINAFGLPPQLNPIAADTATNFLLYRLNQTFKHVGFLPLRRNHTLFASKENGFSTISSVEFNDDLKESDRLIFNIQKLRLKHIQSYNFVEPLLDSIPLTFEDITSQMRKRWPHFIQDMNTFGSKNINNWKPLIKAHDLIDVMRDTNYAYEVLHTMVSQKSSMSMIFPLFLASQKDDFELNTDWFMEYIFENWLYVYQSMPSVFILYFLPNIATLIVSEKKLNQSYAKTLSNRIDLL